MSEFTHKQQERKTRLLTFCLQIINADKPVTAVEQNRDIMETVTAQEVIWVVDELVKQKIGIQELKKGVNKVLNLFYNSLNKIPHSDFPDKSFLFYLKCNNSEMEIRLKKLKPLIRQINNEEVTIQLKNIIKLGFVDLQIFSNHYIIKENVLFPVLENYWSDYRCLQVMWSFQDDIKRNIKEIIQLLETDTSEFDMDEFNRLAGAIFFNMYAIKFREEKILFPQIIKTINSADLDKMLFDSLTMKWPYITPEINLKDVTYKKQETKLNEINLNTGFLFPEQIILMLNHLPIDITFVDEYNKVKYFSSPKKRIFPRSAAIIDRDVNNCHPPESVHVVEKIVESFRKGIKSHAKFWINIGNETVLIQYFAVRDENGIYKGVLEVSQEVSEIKSITGEKRLLEWDM